MKRTQLHRMLAVGLELVRVRWLLSARRFCFGRTFR
jgi:hypothetical protein